MSTQRSAAPARARQPARCRPTLTPLDDRVTPSVTLVKDIQPGAAGADPQQAVAVGPLLYFSADTGSAGRELWKSDGTAAGTTLVKDIRPAGSSAPAGLTALGTTAYFVADDGAHGAELWTSDGTAAGTQLLADLTPGAAGSGIRTGQYVRPVAAGGFVYFLAATGGDSEVWRTDGTAAGTVRLKALGAAEHVTTLAAMGGAAYFGYTNNLPGTGQYTELWKSDGTVAGTVAVRTVGQAGLYQGSVTAVGSVAAMSAGATRLFFSAESQPRDVETWVSDGTASGTYEADLSPDLPGDPHTSYPGQASYRDGYSPVYVVTGDVAYFSDSTDTTGNEIIRLDGVSGALTHIGDTGGAGLATPTKLYYFQSGGELRVYSGGVSTVLLTGVSGTSQLTAVGGLVYFATGSYSGGLAEELWRTDGTPAGTYAVANLNPGFYASSAPRGLVNLAGTLFFTATDGAVGRELWKVEPDATGGRPASGGAEPAAAPADRPPADTRPAPPAAEGGRIAWPLGKAVGRRTNWQGVPVGSEPAVLFHGVALDG